MSARILVVEDDDSLRETLCLGLRRTGFSPRAAATGQSALDAFEQEDFDLVLLDLMIPAPDGYEVCRTITASSDVPVIVLTARTAATDAIRALELGALDYVRKPFDMGELSARVHRLLQRRKAERIVHLDDLQIDLEGHTVRHRDGSIKVTPTEFRLLTELALHPDRVLGHATLLRRVWDLDGVGDANLVATTVKRLRKKLGSAGDSIVSVRGVGYKCSSGSKNKSEMN